MFLPLPLTANAKYMFGHICVTPRKSNDTLVNFSGPRGFGEKPSNVEHKLRKHVIRTHVADKQGVWIGFSGRAGSGMWVKQRFAVFLGNVSRIVKEVVLEDTVLWMRCSETQGDFLGRGKHQLLGE